MKKNVASQRIGCQMISAADGSAFTGTVTVYVCGDAGTQAIGSVGSGICTHEGNGYHTYAPSQGETNYDLCAFTFIGTGAIPATVQVYTNTPQTGDNFARIGAPVGVSISADIAAVKTQTGAIETDTQDIQSRLPSALVSGRMDASVGAMAANVLTATAINADAITAAKVASDVSTEIAAGVWGATTRELSSGANIVLAKGVGVTGFNDLSAAAVNAEVDTGLADVGLTATITGRIDASVSSRASATDLATVAGYIDTEVAAIKSVTDKIDTTLEVDGGGYRFTANALEQAPTGGGSAPTAEEIADAVWDEAISGHLTSGTTGAALNAAGSAGDPWATLLPGAYGAGTAGYIVGTNIDAPISGAGGLDAAGVRAAVGLASANLDTQLDALPTADEVADEVQTRTIAAVATVNGLANNIITAAALASDAVTEIQSGLATSSALATVDSVVDAIQAKTDNLPADPADASDIAAGFASLDVPTVDEIWDEAVDGTVTARQSMRLHNAAMGGKASGLETTTAAYRDLADTKDRIEAVVDANGNRTSVILDLT